MLLYLCKQTKQHETFNRLKHFTASNYGRFLFSYFFNQLFKQLIMSVLTLNKLTNEVKFIKVSSISAIDQTIYIILQIF